MSHDENKPLNINHDGEALGIAVLRSIKKHHKELKVSDIDSVAKVLFDEESPSDTLHMAVEIAINKRQVRTIIFSKSISERIRISY